MASRISVIGLDTATEEIRAAVLDVGVPNGLAVAGARGEQLVKQNIASAFLGRPPAVATGTLANSITFQLSREVNFSRALVFAAPPADAYADYVESGTGPHFPPPSALLLWVKKKFAVTNEKQALSIAFAIARKIAKRGVSAFGMFARALAVLEPELGGIIDAQVAQAIAAAGVGKK
ncbi:MAG TPA: hypothetical protein VKQ28_16820 [Candidatus Acidoferrum sp.]|nr:hypothetical protein [Candidatus Acidoferrum sp.]